MSHNDWTLDTVQEVGKAESRPAESLSEGVALVSVATWAIQEHFSLFC